MGDNKWLRNSFVYVIIMVAVLVLLFAVLQPGKPQQEMSISEVTTAVRAGEVDTIVAHEDSNEIDIKFKDPSKPMRTATKEPQQAIDEILLAQGITADKLPNIR